MTICNMTIEGGARAGLIQPDEKIFQYLKGKPMSPTGENWEKALEYWRTLKSDTDAKFDKELTLDGSQIKPMVTWGTSPQDVVVVSLAVHVSSCREATDGLTHLVTQRALRRQR